MVRSSEVSENAMRKWKNWLKSTLKVTAFDFTYKKHTNKLIHFNLLMNLLRNRSCNYDSDQG